MERDDDVTVWCGNLASDVTEELLYELFLQAGPVNRVTIPKDKEGRRRNFGFITFKHAISIPYALELFSAISLFNEPIRLKNRAGTNLDNHQILANYNLLASSPGNFAHVRNGYVRGDVNEQCPNRRQEPPAGYQRNRNYEAREDNWYSNRDSRRDGDIHGRRYGDEHTQREAYGKERTQRDAYSGDRNRPDAYGDRNRPEAYGDRNRRDTYGSDRNRRDTYGSDRNHRDTYSGDRKHRDGYSSDRGLRDGYSREHNPRDSPPPWLGRGNKDALTSSVSWPPTSPGINILNSFSVDRISTFDDVGRKIPQRTKMVLPKPTQQTFMANAGITQMNAWCLREK